MSASKVEGGGEVGRAVLPEGWAWAAVADVGDVELGRPRHPNWHEGPEMRPYLRVSNVFEDRIDVTGMKEMDFSGVFDKYRLEPGDILLNEGQSPHLVGRPAMYRGEPADVAYTNSLIRFRANTGLLPEWALLVFRNHLHSGRFMREVRITTNIAHLSATRLKVVEFPVPPTAEQQRIITALGTHMARLDAVDRTVASARRDLAALRKAVLLDAVPEPKQWPAHWAATTTGRAGTVELGRARHPNWHTGSKMRPYLRVANVFEDRIDTSDVKDMDFSGVFDKYRLEPGDILLNEGQSPHLVGRPAMYRGIPEGVAFTNSLMRFRAGADVLPGWALLVFRRHLHAGRFMREVRITTNLAHLSGVRLKTVEFPVPPLDEQRQLIRTTKQRLAALDRIALGLDRIARHNTALRRTLLAEASSGCLAPQDPADEPAEELLKRIRVEREAAEAERKVARKAARVGRKATTDPAAPPPAKTDDTTLADGEQTALPLEFNS
ncbi:restriction endonuclease subunit S [Streptomyces sp. NPDC047525]|uniref:restriction endonuclease subunit S n=1 Tax=Streptomyces sp. NPDC047525 TaxID=3155264 RepID=UPI0033D820F4